MVASYDFNAGCDPRAVADRLDGALKTLRQFCPEERGPLRDKFMGATQALAWALDPVFVTSPVEVLVGSPAEIAAALAA